MIPEAILNYFNNMRPGDTIQINKAKDPKALIAAGKEYIDTYGYEIEFNNDYTRIKKLEPWPQ